MASTTDLYGIRKPKNTSKEISSSTGLAFTSTLSSLISSSSATEATRGRQRPSKTKSENAISLGSNRNTKKRAAKDLQDDDDNVRARLGRQDISAVDSSELHRSKRKLTEKAKLYSAMKRGDHVYKENEPESLIDFDRKWAEGDYKEDDSEGLESDDGQGEMVDYEDEYGRARRGTRAEAERVQRKRLKKTIGAEELDRMSARPAMPGQLIYGDTVQTMAFNPDEPVLEKMEEIARKRDRSMTPPEAKHYEADKEVRSKGVGFYSFSKDEKVREREMKALEEERLRTEEHRREREERKEMRRREIGERRKLIVEKRAVKMADSFLDALG